MTDLEKYLFDNIPASGRYVRDIDLMFVPGDEKRVDAALASLVAAGAIKRAGCDIRPMYVRLIGRKAFLTKMERTNAVQYPVASHGAQPAPAGL